MFNVYFYGPLRILVCDATGNVVSVQDRVSGIDAALRYSQAYILAAKTYAVNAQESLYSEA